MPSFSVYFEFSEGDEVFFVNNDVIRRAEVFRAGYSSDSDEPFYDIQFQYPKDKMYGVKNESLYGSFSDVVHNSSWSDRITTKKEVTPIPVDEVEVGMKCFYECQSTKSMIPVVVTYVPNAKASVYLLVKAVNDNVEFFNENGDSNLCENEEKNVCVRVKDMYKSISV